MSRPFLHRSHISLLVLAAISALFAGCVQNAPNNTNSAVSQQQQPAANNQNGNISPNSPAKPEADLSRVPITLPMIDALLGDEAVVSELKSQAAVSDEQIQKLRDAARNAVGQLNENDGGGGRSTTRAAKDAETAINDAVGADKAIAVLQILRKRWAGDGGETANANAKPSDTRIVVNAPAFRMDLFRDGQLVKTYKVGIGYPEFPLPNGMRKATEIIFNPTWTPPDEPWVKGKFAPGKKVEAGSKDNPLGVIKIPIGLPSLIHGGKSPDRIGNFASHGCVGVTDRQIQDIALQLSTIAGNPLQADEIKSYEKSKTETKNVKLQNPIPVDLRYETIVVTDDGKLTIYRDVYERGTNTEENLRRVLDAVGVSIDSLPEADRQKILEGVKSMAFDATGDPVAADASANANAKSKESDSAKVTRNVKGRREVTFDLPMFRGKGYPAPVDLQSS